VSSARGRVHAVGADGRADEGRAVATAADALRRGDVVAIPTDTVYGLAVDPTRPGAAARIFAVKDRPRGVTLPVLVADADHAVALSTEVPAAARRLMARWWPGPLTLVLSRRGGLGMDLGDETTSIGVRCPDHPVPLALIGLVGAIATTSANRHGASPSTTAAEVAGSLPGVTVVVDAGPCAGAPSTVVDCRGGRLRLLRPGSIDWDVLVASAGGA
jgi:L-threonylcarbamoyladenylate synthase